MLLLWCSFSVIRQFEFGMMKLRQVGESSQIEFFEKKHREMKPFSRKIIDLILLPFTLITKKLK